MRVMSRVVASTAALLGLLMFTSPALAQGNLGDQADALRNLRRAMEALATARASADSTKWSEYVTDGFVVIHSDGRMHNREQEIAEIRAATPATGAIKREDEKLHWHGDHTVILASQFVAAGGQRVQAIDVWVRQGSSWKIASAQLTRILARQ
jgi:hypothetical protein